MSTSAVDQFADWRPEHANEYLPEYFFVGRGTTRKTNPKSFLNQFRFINITRRDALKSGMVNVDKRWELKESDLEKTYHVCGAKVLYARDGVEVEGMCNAPMKLSRRGDNGWQATTQTRAHMSNFHPDNDWVRDAPKRTHSQDEEAMKSVGAGGLQVAASQMPSASKKSRNQITNGTDGLQVTATALGQLTIAKDAPELVESTVHSSQVTTTRDSIVSAQALMLTYTSTPLSLDFFADPYFQRISQTCAGTTDSPPVLDGSSWEQWLTEEFEIFQNIVKEYISRCMLKYVITTLFRFEYGRNALLMLTILF